MDANVIDCLLKLHVSKCLFVEVGFGCGSSTKIKTANIERIICATELNLRNITMYHKSRKGKQASLVEAWLSLQQNKKGKRENILA